MIEVKNLSKSFSKLTVFKDLNLTIEENRIYGLFARNGVGKTTLMRILSDQLINYDGEILFNGESIKDNPAYKSKVIMISEDLVNEYLKEEKLTATIDIIKSFLTNFNVERFYELMNFFNINHKMKYKNLSLGNQTIFRNTIGLASGCDYIFYDEPTIGLDEVNRDKFYKKLMEYQDLDESTIIISSHHVSDIEKIITDVIILKDKKAVINESIYDIETKAYSIMLNPTSPDFLTNKNIISTDSFGNQKIVNVYDDFTREELDQIKAMSGFNKLSLRDLFLSINKEDTDGTYKQN